MSWKLKTTEEGAPVVTDEGKIVYINPDGEELPLDPPQMYEKIQTLGKNNQKDREKYQQMRDTLAIFDGIDDLPKWKEDALKAMEAVANFNEKDWLKADKVDALKKEITAAYEDKLKARDVAYAEKEAAKDQVIGKKDAQIRQLLVSNKFAVSEYFNGSKSKTLLPPDLAESYFGKHFRVEESEDGTLSIKAYNSSGDPILSKVNPGEPAPFEEAIGLIVDSYPHKNQILRASKPGSGGAGGDGDGSGGGDTLTSLRAQLKKAQEAGNAQLAISLKNKIHEIQAANAA